MPNEDTFDRAPTATPDGDIAGFRVLVVDDNYHMAASLSSLLEGIGCSVVGPAATAEQAHQLVEETTIDGAILDVHLAQGTSVSVARAMLSDGLPFVFVTGSVDAGAVPEDVVAKCQRVLHKPYGDHAIRSAIRQMAQCVGRHGDQDYRNGQARP